MRTLHAPSICANLRKSADKSLGNWDKTYTDLAQTTLEEDRLHDVANELTSFATPANYADPHSDVAGNMTRMPQPADLTKAFTATYDAWNRMVEVKDGANTVQTNEYDGLGRRIVRSVYVSGSLDHRIRYYYNEQWQLLEERKEVSGTEDPDPLAQYVWHPYYIDALAVRYYDADTNGISVTQYYLQDANFNVTAVTDDTGTALERYAYTPYGMVTFLYEDFTLDADQKSDIGNNHLYTGRERDPETGLQLNRHRFYASHLGRWLNRDPIGYADGSNLYRAYFVLGELDPNGTDCPGCDVPDTIGGGLLNDSDCALACCAQHDECYDDHDCTSSSWGYNAGGAAVLGIFGGACTGGAGATSGAYFGSWLSGMFSPCAKCNHDVAVCISLCQAGNHMQGKPLYYCQQSGQFITIGPGAQDDFPDRDAADAACCD